MKDCAISVGYFNHGEEKFVEAVNCCYSKAGDVVNGVIEGVASNGHGEVGRLGSRCVHEHRCDGVGHIDAGDGRVVFPREGVFVVEFPKPLFADDGHVVCLFVVRDGPDGVVGGEGHHDEPDHNQTRKDIKKHFQPRVVTVDGEGPNLDVVKMGRVRFNALAVPQDGQKHPPEGEDAHDNGPEHEFIIENRKDSIFCDHAITLFYPP